MANLPVSALGVSNAEMPLADRHASVVATIARWHEGSRKALSKLAPEVSCIEVRADLAGDIDHRDIRARFVGKLLYTLRSTAAGGHCADPPRRRQERLIAAAAGYDFIDLEAGRDLHPALLEQIPPDRRVLSWHGPAADLTSLRRTVDEMTTVRAHLYRLVPRAESQAEALLPLLALRSAGRGDLTAFASGPAGIWTRVLAARYGASAVFARLDSDGLPADGELSLDRLLAGYPLDAIYRARQTYGIIGGSTAASLSPLVHNTAYRSLGMPALFLPFSASELSRSVTALSAGLADLGLPLRGMTVIAPHKEAALALAATATPLARRVGAASLLVRTPDGWWADTEAAGVVSTLAHQQVSLAGQHAAVIGCGGAGRAAAAGLSDAGARVTLVNRGAKRGLNAARRLGLPFVALRDFHPKPFSLLIHATPVTDTLLFPTDDLNPSAIVFDLNYGAADTRLVASVRAGGYQAIDGRHMLLAELARQFQLMTSAAMPVADVARALGIPPPRAGGSGRDPGKE